MRSVILSGLAAAALLTCGIGTAHFSVAALALDAPVRQAGATERINLAERLAAGKLRAVNRQVTTLDDREGVQMSAGAGNGVTWVEGTDFAEGTIELDIRGRDLFQQSFVGVAFHRSDDNTYECVYLRPFNFRSDDSLRKQHAVQYITHPEFDWPRLRKEFPEEFENPVDASVSPTDWVPVRVVVRGKGVQVYVGGGKSPALEVRKLGQLERGMIGLWTGNMSDGAFSNLRVTPAK